MRRYVQRCIARNSPQSTSLGDSASAWPVRGGDGRCYAWRVTHPWAGDDQFEQDLAMARVAVESASLPDLRDRLAWRRGTCLQRLFLPTALRYSEDLDYAACGRPDVSSGRQPTAAGQAM